jgi:hypothetical protein
MPWRFFVLEFVSGLLLANGVPHFVQGVSGQPFRRARSSAVLHDSMAVEPRRCNGPIVGDPRKQGPVCANRIQE